MANLASLVKRFDPGKMLGGAISSGVGRFRSNIGSGDKGYRVMMRGYSTIKSFERRFASRDSGKSRPAGPVGGPTRRAPSTSPLTPAGAPARTDHIAAGEEFTHKGNVYIVPEGHVFDTRSGRLIADPATSKSRSFVSFAKAGVIMQSSFDNFKTVTFRKLDKIIDLVSKLQPSPVVAAPLEEVKKPEEVGAPEKEKPSNWLPFLAGMLSGLGLRYFVRPLVALFQRIMKWITGLWTAVRKLFTRIANAIISAFKRFWQFMSKIKDAFLRVVKFVKNLIPKTWEALKKIGKNIGEFFTKKFTAAKDFIKNRLSSVANFLKNLGRRALVTLGKAVIRMAPQLAGVLRNKGGRIGDAIKAAQAEIKAAAAAKDALKAGAAVDDAATKAAKQAAGAKLLAESKTPGMRLLKVLQKIPGLNIAAQIAIAAWEINEADKVYEKDKDKKKYDTEVGNIVVGNLGSLVGSSFGWALGMGALPFMTTKGALLGALLGGVAGAGVGAAPGGVIGGILGLGAGLTLALGLSTLFGVAGDWGMRQLFEINGGDPEKLGAFINDLTSSNPPDSEQIQKATERLNDNVLQLEKRDSSKRKKLEGEIEKDLSLLYKSKLITRADYHRLRDVITKIGAGRSKSEDFLLPTAAIPQQSPSLVINPQAPSEGSSSPATTTSSSIPSSSAPASLPPPAPASPASTPQSQSSVQPVPPQTPPAPDEQRDEFGNIVVINSQTNNSHTTVVSGQPTTPRSSTTSPDPWQHIGL